MPVAKEGYEIFTTYLPDGMKARIKRQVAGGGTIAKYIEDAVREKLERDEKKEK